MATSPGPILTVTAGRSDTSELLGSLREAISQSRALIESSNEALASGEKNGLRIQLDALRDSLGQQRILIAQNNSAIATERRAGLEAQTNDEKRAAQQRIASIQEVNAQIRESITQVQAQAQRVARDTPKIPLKVEVEGAGEAFSVIREELGILLGPLNGITGRLTSLGSLFKTLGKSALESGGSAEEGLKKTGQAAEGALSSVGKLALSVVGADSALVNSSKQLSLFANTAGGVAGEQLNLFANTVEKGVASEVALGSAAEEAAVGAASLSSAFSSLLAPLLIVGTALAVTVASLFEAGKSTAELGEKFEQLGLRVGVGANDMQALAHATAASNVPLEALISGMTRLSFQLTGSGGKGVIDGTTRTRQQVELLIGSIEGADGKIIPTIEILEKLADVFKALPNGAERVGLATALFGRQVGTQLIPFLEKGRAGISGLVEEFNKLDLNLEGQPEKARAYSESVEKISAAWDKLKGSFAKTGVFETITGIFGGIAKRINDLAGYIDSLTSKWDKLTDAINKVSPQGAPTGAYNKTLGPAGITGQVATPSITKVEGESKGAEGVVKGANDVLTRDQLITSGALASLDEYSKKVTEVLHEVNKADEAFGTLGGPGTQLKGRTQDIEAMRKELTGLIGQMRAADAVAKTTINRPAGAGPADAGPISSVVKNLPQLQANLERIKELSSQLAAAERQAAEEAERLAKEQQNLAREFEKTGRAAEENAVKQLAPATQIKFYSDQVAQLTEQQNKYVTALQNSIPQSLLQAAGVKTATEAQTELAKATEAVRLEDQRYQEQKAANAARQIALRSKLTTGRGTPDEDRQIQQELATLQDQQRQSEQAHKEATDALNVVLFNAVKAYDQTIEAIARLLPYDANLQAIETQLKETTTELNQANEGLTESHKATAAATDADTQKKVQLLEQSQKLAQQQSKLDTELDAQSHKQDTLRDRVLAAQVAYSEQAQIVADATEKLATLTKGTEEYITAQQELANATRGEIDAYKELNQAQDELKKNSIDLKKAFSEVNDIVEAFGGTLPKPLTKIIAMIDAMQKLLKTIDAINATRGINIPVQGGGQGSGSSGGSGGIGGLLDLILGRKKGGSSANLGQEAPAVAGDVDSEELTLANSGSSSEEEGGGLTGKIGSIAQAGIAGGGIGAAVSAGGNQTVGSIGGTIAGVGVGLLAVNPIVGGVVAGVGAVITLIGALLGNAKKQAQTIAKEIANFTASTVAAVNASDETLVQGLQTLQGQRQQAIQQLSAKGNAGNQQLAQLLPQIDQQIEQIKGQAQQVQTAFAEAFQTSQLPQAIQSYGDQIQQLNKQVKDYVNAGGSAATATQFLVNQLNAMKVAIGNSLLQSEQQAIQLLQQEIQLQIQKGQVIQQEAQQEADILNQGVQSRQRSTAQTQAQQILALRQQRDQQLTGINEQIAQTRAQLGNQQEIFGLSLNQNSLLQAQLAVQRQITAQTDQQIINLEKLQAYLPTSPTAVSATGAPQIPVPTSTLTPGQSQGALPGSVPINSGPFLKVLLSTGVYGQKVLRNLFGSVPATLTSDQMQQIITALQTGNSQGRNLLPQLTAALTAAQNSQYQFNGGLTSSLGTVPTPVSNTGTGGSLNVGNGITIPTSASTSSSARGAISSTGAPAVNIETASSVTIGSGGGAVSLSDAATATKQAATVLQTASDTLSGGASDLARYSGSPASTTVSSASGGGAVLPTGSQRGTTVPYIDQSVLAGLEPNVPSAQAGLPPPVLGINEVTDASQLAAAQFTAPFLPIVQAIGNLLSVGSASYLQARKPVATPIPARFNPGAQFSGVPASVTVNIEGTTNMNKADVQKAVTDGFISAYNSLRARGGATVKNGS
jgi:chromosome segregation ATPase